MYAIIKRELYDVWIGFFRLDPAESACRTGCAAKRHGELRNYLRAALPWSTSVASSVALAFFLGF